MKTGHPWHCPACGTTQRGMSFPYCGACENTLSPDGEDALEMMNKHVKEIRERLWKYMEKEDGELNPLYSLQDSLIKRAVDERKVSQHTTFVYRTSRHHCVVK
jgi:uncharacterized HAD superfamily protein